MKIKSSIVALQIALWCAQPLSLYAQEGPAAGEVAASRTEQAAKLASEAAVRAETAAKDAAASAKEAGYSFSSASASQEFSGVRLSYPVRVLAKVAGTDQWVCIPAKFPLRGLSSLTDKGLIVKLRPDTKADFSKIVPTEFDLCDGSPAPAPASPKNTIPLESALGLPLQVPKETAANYMPTSNGLTYGILVVPFKYHLRGSKDFKGAGSVGPYAGYKTQSSNWAAGVEFVGFAGLGMVESSIEKDGKPATETLTAFSYGVAAIGRIHDKFQIGLVAGQDRVGKSSNYKDNGKWWLAVSIGYPFSN